MPVGRLNPHLMPDPFLVTGYLFGLAAKRLKPPRVTGCIIAGPVLSPSVTGIMEARLVERHLVFVTGSAAPVLFIVHEAGAKGIMDKKRIQAFLEETLETVLARMAGAGIKEMAAIDDEGRILADINALDLLRSYHPAEAG